MSATTKTRRPNRYAGKCVTCSTHVPAEAGFLGDRVGGRWTVRCAAHGATPAMPTLRPARAPQHVTTPATAYRPPAGELDHEYVAFVAVLILEEGGIQSAWNAITELNEFWDGEPEPREYAKAKFDAHLYAALTQNEVIHGETYCIDCGRPGRRAVDCHSCQYDVGLL